MRVIIIVNPIAGSGNAVAAAEAACRELRREHDVDVVTTRPEPAEGYLPAAVAGADLAVVVGGDGTLRHAIGVAAEAGAAIYQVPFGTENLFAREWGMSPDVADLVKAIGAGRYATVDRAIASGVPFLLMASIGFDAEVVHDLAGRRRGAIRLSSYALPILRQLVRWRPPALRIEVDGAEFVRGRGVAIVANCRQYAARLDPARQADMADGVLDVVWLACPVRIWIIRWMAAMLLGRGERVRGAVTTRGARITIDAEQPVHFQVDGDPPQGPGSDRVERLEIEVLRADVRVLLPA